MSGAPRDCARWVFLGKGQLMKSSEFPTVRAQKNRLLGVARVSAITYRKSMSWLRLFTPANPSFWRIDLVFFPRVAMDFAREKFRRAASRRIAKLCDRQCRLL